MADGPPTILVCPECGRDNFASGGRGKVYHWRDCPFQEEHPWSGRRVWLVPAAAADRLAEAVEAHLRATEGARKNPASKSFAVEVFDTWQALRSALSEYHSQTGDSRG